MTKARLILKKLCFFFICKIGMLIIWLNFATGGIICTDVKIRPVPILFDMNSIFIV